MWYKKYNQFKCKRVDKMLFWRGFEGCNVLQTHQANLQTHQATEEDLWMACKAMQLMLVGHVMTVVSQTIVNMLFRTCKVISQ